MHSQKPKSGVGAFIGGFIVGAIVLSIAGFVWWGWVLGGTATQMAETRAQTAIVEVLTPVCVAQFLADANVAARYEAFKAASEYGRRDIVRRDGYANLPGTDTANHGLAESCSLKLTEKYEDWKKSTSS